MHTLTIDVRGYSKQALVYAVFFVVVMYLYPVSIVSAASDRSVAGWIPYWQDVEGIESVEEHARDLDTVHPFIFEVQSDGSIKDMSGIDEDHWDDLFDIAERRNIEIIPTIAWFNGDKIHEILSGDDDREEHIEAIIALVEDHNFDGIDIDYEGKNAETIDHFSEFLEELKDELGSATLTCTVEARTPPERKWRDVPENIEYANDYEAMNEHCDRIEIMAYDQQRIDWMLNTERSGEPYIPVADTSWVAEVIEYALEDIDADKVMLGVPTYGREWTLTVEPNWYKAYESITSLNMPDALEIADEYKVTPGRNLAGEMSFSYFPEDSIFSVLDSLPVPEGTRQGNEAAAKALLFANATGMTVPVNVVWYSDAGAIRDKIELAEKYGLRGIAMFKIDGEEDEEIWDLF